MITFTLFICLIQIKNAEICTVYRKSAIRIMNKKRYEFLLILPYPTLKKRAFGNVLLDALSCGLRREAESFFPQTEFMPFKFKYNSHFDNILVKI